MIPFSSDESGVAVDEGVPDEPKKEVTATTFVTRVTPPVESEVVSTKIWVREEEASEAYWVVFPPGLRSLQAVLPKTSCRARVQRDCW